MAESPSPPHNQMALLAQPAVSAAAASSRRLPPPCWSHDETVALIDAYRDKWYSLRRGNLRANHWQDVADAVAERCPPSETPAKTSVQCRHKMEKLRKRYRGELQRSSSNPNKGHRLSSSWVHFKRMEYMEKGPPSATPDLSPEDNDEDEVDDEEELYQSVRRGGGGLTRQNIPNRNPSSNGSGGKGGFRIRLPACPPGPLPQAKIYNDNNPNARFGSNRVLREGHEENWGFGKRSGGGGEVGGKKKREGEAVGEIVGAIKALGDGFVRMEKMKMEMAREVEAMRMDMEMKRTEMILESQQRIVEAFGKAFSEKRNKKVKRMPTPES